MKAFIVDRYGSADRLRTSEVPDPEMRDGWAATTFLGNSRNVGDARHVHSCVDRDIEDVE
jgi:hypothetical protein